MADPDSGATQSAMTEADVPAAMRAVYRRLQRWRSQRKGRERIPEALWAAAGELARAHGVNQVSRALHLEFSHLKRVAETGPLNGGKQARPSFVELIAPATSAGRECILELEGTRGKLRIELRGMPTAEVAGISRALWEMLA
jgi:hypothetical protein